MTDMMYLEASLDLLYEKTFPNTDLFMTEASVANLGKRLVEFIKKLIEQIKTGLSKIGKGKKAQRVEKAKLNLRKYKKFLEKNPKLKSGTVSCIDFIAYEKTLEKYVSQMTKIMKGFNLKYESSGAGLRRTNQAIQKIQTLMTTSNQSLSKIKNTKKEMKVSEVLKWIDAKLSEGTSNLEDLPMVQQYMDVLKDAEDFVKRYGEKVDAYAEKTGMIANPKGAGDTMKNVGIYITRNLDWIGTIAITLAVASIGDYVRTTGVDMVRAEVDEDYPIHKGSLVNTPENNQKETARRIKENEMSKAAAKRYHAGTAVNATALAMGTGDVLYKLSQAKQERRNSV